MYQSFQLIASLLFHLPRNSKWIGTTQGSGKEIYGASPLNCETFPKRKLSSLDKKDDREQKSEGEKGGWKKRPLFEVPFFPHGMHHSGLLLKILTGWKLAHVHFFWGSPCCQCAGGYEWCMLVSGITSYYADAAGLAWYTLCCAPSSLLVRVVLLFSCTTSNFHCGFSQPQASAKDIGSNFFARVPFPEKHVNLRTATWPRNSCSCASYFCATVLGVKKSPVKPRDARETLKRVEMVGASLFFYILGFQASIYSQESYSSEFSTYTEALNTSDISWQPFT